MSKNLHEIIATKESAEADLFARSGVTAVDVGYKYVNGQRTDEVAIRVMVAKKSPKVSAADKVPETIDGVKTDVIERTYFLHDEPANRKRVDDITLQADTGTYSPVKGGISIGPCRAVGGFVYVGTLGAIVKDNATGNPMLLSNFHVMCIDNGSHVGDTMAQPGRVDGGTCPASVVGTLQRSALTGLVDCAVASLSGRGYSCEIVDIGRVAGTAVATLGQAVRKRGRTTGLTYGFVESVSLSVNIDYGDGIGVKTLTNQIGIRPDTAHNAAFGDHGDSGSAVVDGSVNVVGLHFAGSSDGHGIANMIANVMSALDVTMCTGTITKAPLKDFKDTHKDAKLEKVEHKDLKAEKLETKDHKNEKLEHKDVKIEKIETKDHKVEKLERKEIKEIEKPILDNGPGKGPVETGPTGPIGGPVIGAGATKVTDKQIKETLKTEKPESKDLKDHKPESKESKDHHDNKVHKDAKDFKDGPDHKQAKDHKDGKDNPDNKLHKDQKDHKDTPDNKAHKDHKDLKDHKEQGKDNLKPELKDTLKELEKAPISDTDPKGMVDGGPVFTNPGFPGEAGVDQRMSQLEATVAALSTFITGDLRPDLSTGALNNESDGGCTGGC
ncbi:MAG TPA: hypothetical protein VIP05_07220 [Burkholderiaceae bacterium]